jgi:hypothetical protein
VQGNFPFVLSNKLVTILSKFFDVIFTRVELERNPSRCLIMSMLMLVNDEPIGHRQAHKSTVRGVRGKWYLRENPPWMMTSIVFDVTGRYHVSVVA